MGDVQEQPEVALSRCEHHVVAVDQVNLPLIVDHGVTPVGLAVCDHPGKIGLVEAIGKSVMQAQKLPDARFALPQERVCLGRVRSAVPGAVEIVVQEMDELSLFVSRRPARSGRWDRLVAMKLPDDFGDLSAFGVVSEVGVVAIKEGKDRDLPSADKAPEFAESVRQRRVDEVEATVP